MVVKRFRKEEEVYLKGKIKWCKHLRPDATYDKYSVCMFITGEDLEKVREWQAQGIRNQLKKDETDGWYITLSRKTSIETRGKVIPLLPPKVIDKDGNVITDMVGNGSDGIAKCILWSFNPAPNISGKALRWEALRVDNLVKYTPENDYPDGGEDLKDLKKEEALF